MSVFTRILSKIFRRRNVDNLRTDLIIGNDPEALVNLRSALLALNFAPVNYEYTHDYACFLVREHDDIVDKALDECQLDDLNANIFDALIDGKTNEMAASAKLQFNAHTTAIEKISRMIEEEILATKLEIANQKLQLEQAKEICDRYADLLSSAK